MRYYVRHLIKSKGQSRVTIPVDLVKSDEWSGVDVVKISTPGKRLIMIEPYEREKHGKGNKEIG